MVVRIRFGRGAAFSRRAGKNSRVARLAASLLTLASICFGSLGVWRIGMDLGWTGSFVFTAGVLSHWQVWIGAACATQYLAWQLSRYARKAIEALPASQSPEESAAMPAGSRV